MKMDGFRFYGGPLADAEERYVECRRRCEEGGLDPHDAIIEAITQAYWDGKLDGARGENERVMEGIRLVKNRPAK